MKSPPLPKLVVTTTSQAAVLINLNGAKYLANEPKARQHSHTSRDQQHRRAHEDAEDIASSLGKRQRQRS